ncbi:hypothetical protein OIU83_17815 [Flavobacterium sp. LS1R49]|uniref:Uncharacterized protein n=1 Tax=Flavobacterium shii TaxID=2987687 RepID=A0A9X2YWC3_9FLAO|nr:hypothetical protein [Flavobacterium shii]MCV9929523.1 hypothetical protein [Flavobacterium shii]
MALSKAILKGSLLAIFQEMSTNNDQQNSIETLAEKLSGVIFDFVKTAEVVAGQGVATTGTAAAQTGKTTTNGTII